MENMFFNEMTRTMLENIEEGVYLTDRNRIIIYWNRAAERITGFPSSEVMGKGCSDNILNHVDDRGNFLCKGTCPIAVVLVTGEKQEMNIYLHHREGYRFPVRIVAMPWFDGEGNIIGILEIFSDTSESRISPKKLEALKEKMYIDTTVGIGNRALCDRVLEKRFRGWHDLRTPFTAAVCEIDDYDEIRETRDGETAGRLLKMAGLTLAKSLQGENTIGRWSEERFLIIFPYMDNSYDALAEMDRLRILVQESFLPLDEERLYVTVSIGVSAVEGEDNQESLLARIDRLLRRSQHAGKNRVSIG